MDRPEAPEASVASVWLGRDIAAYLAPGVDTYTVTAPDLRIAAERVDLRQPLTLPAPGRPALWRITRDATQGRCGSRTRGARPWALAAWACTLGTLLLAGGILFPTAVVSAQGTPGPIVVEMGERGAEFYFAPNEIAVPAGTVRLTFRNVGARRHNWVLESLGQRTPDIDAGGTFEETFTFANPGTYEFICDLPTHAARGMIGRLVVSPAGAAPAPPAGPSVAPGAQGVQPTAAPTRPPSGAPPGTFSGTPGPVSTAGAAAAPGAGTQNAAQAQSTVASPGGTPMFVSLAIHIPASIAWLGVVLYQALVGLVPFLSPSQRADLLQRPKWLALATIPLFMVTGIYQTIYNPFVTITDLESLERFRAGTTYGLALFWKHGFVMISVALTLAVTFWFAPRMATVGAAAATTSGRTLTVDATQPATSRLPALLTWANVAACLALLLCVAVIVFQLH